MEEKMDKTVENNEVAKYVASMFTGEPEHMPFMPSKKIKKAAKKRFKQARKITRKNMK